MVQKTLFIDLIKVHKREAVHRFDVRVYRSFCSDHGLSCCKEEEPAQGVRGCCLCMLRGDYGKRERPWNYRSTFAYSYEKCEQKSYYEGKPGEKCLTFALRHLNNYYYYMKHTNRRCSWGGVNTNTKLDSTKRSSQVIGNNYSQASVHQP